ncbi:MAG: hypothetical protein RMJ98_15795 [Myxococcales bacterium]|nr:hypothetical protein [Polyangiaceae bacterium]MDW8250759.1 hypothetical protein [Myxococcales bacterium]
MTWTRWIGFSLLLALLEGCVQTKRVSLREGPREYVSYDYDQILQRWTRSGSVVALAEFDDLLTVSATFQSWDFRWAYTIRYAEDYRLTVEQRQALLDETLAETREEHRFYVALYGPNRRWNDLSRKDSAWVVRLIDDKGNETPARQIKPIPRPGAVERTYFPYSNVWRQSFYIIFPTRREDGTPTIAHDARWFGLRFAGAQGHSDLIWELEPG